MESRCPGQRWLLLVLSLPTESATGRMRIWRSLKGLGCVALRDGVYLLPSRPAHESALRELAAECGREGGVAWTLNAVTLEERDQEAFPKLFDRAGDYAALSRSWIETGRRLTKMKPAEVSRVHRKLARDFDALRAIDFFPNEASGEADLAWQEFTGLVERTLSPDEPQDWKGQVPNVEPEDYRDRTWATRRDIWIDRVASAWLIRRFIDPGARFLWLEKPADCPAGAVGFDFDGAMFSHVGDRVTFETLVECFALSDDVALRRLGSMVNALDVGGPDVPEAAGFEAVLTGARDRLNDDDALLDAMSAVLDSLHAHFSRDGSDDGPTARKK
jgi:hypothetical protein